MAITINEIVKESLESLKRDSQNLTPDNYTTYFCKVAKSKGVIVEDCCKIDKFIKKLDPVFQQDLKKFSVNTIEELLSYLIAKISRLNESNSSIIINSLTILTKRVLQVITLLHDREARELANDSLARLDFSQNLKLLDMMKEKWFEYVTSYNDDFLHQLDIYGHVNKNDLKKMVDDIIQILKKDDESTLCKVIAPLVVASLAPSIASSMNDDLASISHKLRSDPGSLATVAIQEEIKYFIKKRMKLDNEDIKNKISSLDKLLDEINIRIFTLIDNSEISNKQVSVIKKDLQGINFSKDSFELIQIKLVNIATSLEDETKSLSFKMKKNQNTINALHHKIKNLEKALAVTKKEAKEDFLTHVAAKRALEQELKRVEEAYKRYKTDYSLCFLDIDNFKMVNDTYGHEAGDVILANIGKILNNYIRECDFVGRYGGEEFLIILPSIDMEQAFYFSNKIRKIIESYKFLYKNERIEITVSCGLSQRSLQKSSKETVEFADKMLYKAKESGRNMVQPIF